ncbi:DNA-binding protein [Leptolyngbya cf. ectocarpi LEGE 11479]|uniref:DNA-binding protein n=1 Tax=Leptolyngbya cf. ectocarpi LEGE 11479 TaxID=1828722 RepID=A0A928ZWD1_LEPEC|nr:DUF6399 domain-containing protein [Leptolyngbya ectocarpi]MBE9068683.1 DNA-binding protein [Leptolyngbya cf. ectocarpi LEGE 11479]
MSLTIRERSQKVAGCIKADANQGIESIASALGMSKSSVHRHQQGIARRNQYAESELWETASGSAWLKRLVLGVLYHFGIKHGIGAESLCEFFKSVHLETHVGVSASALRQVKHRVEEVIVAYAVSQSEQCQSHNKPGICLGGDETFFGLPILVLVELASGFIFTEVECENRQYATWRHQLEQWWHPSDWQCHFMVSDGARALVKLAISGLGTVSVADLFHAMRALARPIGSALGRQLAQVEKQLDTLQPQVNQAKHKAKQQTLNVQLETLTQQYQQLEQDQHTYHRALADISQAVHPFTLDTPQWQLFDDLTTQLAAPLKTLTHLAKLYGGDKAQHAIDTFDAQIPQFANGIHAWWQWVMQALASETQETDVQNWVLTAVLPWVYWAQQTDKTRKPHLKARYQQAASDAYDQLMAHAMTLQIDDAQRQYWVQWCQWMCAKYQRTSSAVEGRNGYLSQRHHVNRGFSAQSLKVLTIIHNFDLKRPDGTTAAQRLFGHSFPDLFEWILGNINELPMPRRSSKAHQVVPLHVELFPA